MKQLFASIALLSLTVLLFACGGSGDSVEDRTKDVSNLPLQESKFPLQDDAPGDPYVRFVADPEGELAYNVAMASASPGKVTVELVNSRSVPHNLVLEDKGGKVVAKTETVSEDITSTAAVVKPGEYVTYCTIPGHRKAGMQGTLIVYPE